jgi:hypothetical protein
MSCALAKARYDRLFDGVVENGDDFSCGRGTFNELIWITLAMPLRHGRSEGHRRHFDHYECAFGASGLYDRVS